MALVDILSRGFFPKELPEPFVTDSFAQVVTGSGALPAGFSCNVLNAGTSLPKAIPVKYTISRRGILRRRLDIPNPVLYYLLCKEINSNWSSLQSNIGGTSISVSNPVLYANGRAINVAEPMSRLKELAVETRLNNRYILKTDISRFYHSIYTHSIPWALHTKAVAKADRSMALLGNRLDLLVRNCQDQQTVGIPIGPDTSLVISEIIMQECDRAILTAFPNLRGHRNIDDYELGFRTRTDAENAFHIIEKILADYELALNPKKTKVVELPCELESPWLNPLRTFNIRRAAARQQSDLLQYFDLATDLHNRYTESGVLQYAVSRLRHEQIATPNWSLFQKLLLNCVVVEPATLPFVLQSIILRVNDGAIAENSILEEVMNTLILFHSGLVHSSEVAWALWACLAFGLNLTREAVNEVSKCDDSIVALMALHCEAEGLVATPLDRTLWLRSANSEGLYGEHWLLAYEANVKGWLISSDGRDYVSSDPNFGFLKTKGVSFYDVNLAVQTDADSPKPVPRPDYPKTFPGSLAL